MAAHIAGAERGGRRMGNERLAGFPPRAADKVERLLDLLEEIG